MKPYYEHAGITIYHGDCREILPTLPKCDLLLTDPPYGMNWNTDSTRFGGGRNPSKKGRGVNRARVHGDDAPFDPTFLLEKSPRVILWGFNHFPQYLSQGTALVWLKRHDDAFQSFLSDAEIAWMNSGCGIYCRRDLSNQAITNERVHPTQKPVGLMQWCIGFVDNAQTVLDPFMGSGTTLVAAKNLGRKAIGIEIEEKYCEIAAKRLAQEVLEFA